MCNNLPGRLCDRIWSKGFATNIISRTTVMASHACRNRFNTLTSNLAVAPGNKSDAIASRITLNDPSTATQKSDECSEIGAERALRC